MLRYSATTRQSQHQLLYLTHNMQYVILWNIITVTIKQIYRDIVTAGAYYIFSIAVAKLAMEAVSEWMSKDIEVECRV